MECVTEKNHDELPQESVTVDIVPLLTGFLEQFALQISIPTATFAVVKSIHALTLISVNVQATNHLVKVMCSAPRLENVSKSPQENVLVHTAPPSTGLLENFAPQISNPMVLFAAAKRISGLTLISVNVQATNHFAKIMCTVPNLENVSKLCQENALVHIVPLLMIYLELLAPQTSILMVIFVAIKKIGALNLIFMSVQAINHFA